MILIGVTDKESRSRRTFSDKYSCLILTSHVVIECDINDKQIRQCGLCYQVCVYIDEYTVVYTM